MRWFEMFLYVAKTAVYLAVFFYAGLAIYNPEILDTQLTLTAAMIAGLLEFVHNGIGTYKYFDFKSEQDKIKDAIKKEIKEEIIKEVMEQVQEENEKSKDAIFKEVEEKLQLKEDGD